MSRSPIRLQFVHGLESSPQGTKARLLADHFEAVTPAMDTTDFEGCVRQQALTLSSFKPQVLVGSSFGGAVAVALLQRGLWSGPTLLLAQAALRYDADARLPEGTTVWLVHGSNDDIVAPDDSRKLALTGSPDRVRLIEVDDDHRLTVTVASGKLVELVEQLASGASTVAARETP